MIKTEKLKCLICGKDFIRLAHDATKRQRKTGIRKRGSYTCSKPCSKISVKLNERTAQYRKRTLNKLRKENGYG